MPPPKPGPGIVGRLILEYEQTDSTNNRARELGETGEPEGIAVTAQRQTGGRGRGGAHWFSERHGALCVSILFRPQHWAERITLLPLLVALSAAEAAESVCPNLSVTLKWPNDLMIDRRKLGGVLCEMFGNDRTLFVAAGLGLNANLTPFDFPPEIRKRAVSLSEASGRSVETVQLTEQFLRRLDAYYAEAATGRTDRLLMAMRARMPMLGRSVTITTSGTVVEGIAQELLPHGELLVQTPSGKRITVVSGHVERYT